MKTNVELLGEKLGRTLADMTKFAEQGDERAALGTMAVAKAQLNALRRACGIEDVPPTAMAQVEVSWKNMIEGRVRAAKRAV